MAAALLLGPWILLFVSTPTYLIYNSLGAAQGAVGRGSEWEVEQESGAAAAESDGGATQHCCAEHGIYLTILFNYIKLTKKIQIKI